MFCAASRFAAGMVLLISSCEYVGNWLTDVGLVWIAFESRSARSHPDSLIDADLAVDVPHVVLVVCPRPESNEAQQ